MRVIGALALAVMTAMAFGQTYNRVIEGGLMAAPPTIDGEITDQEWAAAVKTSGFVDNNSGAPVPDDTEVRLGYDKEAVYIAFLAHDSQPSKIVARTVQDGLEMDGEDVLAIVLDPLNRRTENRSVFLVNPLGATYEQIAGGRSGKREWRGLWKAKAKTTPNGWQLEVKIPWKILPLPSGGKSDIQLNFERYQTHTLTGSRWSDNGKPYRAERDGTWKAVECPRQPIELSFQGYATPEYDERQSPKVSFRTGVDARAKLTSTLFALGSINPDFRNIEQEVASISFTRSERYLNDARPFFQEGKDYFNLNGGFSFASMFYSNRIEDFDEGIKFYGDLNKKDSVGLLATREDGNRLDGVFKYHRQLGTRSEASVYGTTTQTPGIHNSALGATVGVGTGNWGYGGEMAGTRDKSEAWKGAGAAYLEYNPANLFVIVRAMKVSPGFNPSLGLVPFDDRNGAYLYGEHWKKFAKGVFKNFYSSVGGDFFEREDGSNRYRNANASVRFVTRSDFSLGFDYNVGKFADESEQTVGVNAVINQSNNHKKLGIYANTGTRGGEKTTFVSAFGNLRVLKGLDLSLSHDIQDYIESHSQTVGSISWEIDKYQSLAARWVGRESSNGWYLSYRKSGNKGLEWYAILGDPNSLSFRNRFAIKVIWAK